MSKQTLTTRIHWNPSNGFTLVELLVAVAIIALLIGILIPSLSRARQAAQGAVCRSNIRQLALANIGYAQENDDYYVIGAPDLNSSNLKRWHGVRSSANEIFDPSLGPLRDYLGQSGKVKECPSFSKYYNEAGQGAGFEAGCGGYGYNSSYIGGRYDVFGVFSLAPFGKGCEHSARTNKVTAPGSTVMFTDAAFLQNHQGAATPIAYSFSEPPFWQLKPGKPSSHRPNPTIHFRHLGATHVAWCDGHVSSERPDFSAPYLTHLRVNAKTALELDLGWFGPDSNQLFDLK